MWAAEVQHECKTTEKRLKEKWAQLVVTETNKRVKAGATSLKSTQEVIAIGYPRVKDIYAHYLNYSLVPMAGTIPIVYKLNKDYRLKVYIDAIGVSTNGKTKVLLYTESKHNQHIPTRLKIIAQAFAAKETLGIKEFDVYKLTRRGDQTVYSFKPQSRHKQWLLNACQQIESKIDIPILNCHHKCPYKQKCK